MSFEHNTECTENDARCGCYEDRIAALTSELAEARRQLGEAETRIATYQAERDLACTALADTARERDAYRDSKRLGAWARAIVSQCRQAGTSVFVKQLGPAPLDGGAPMAGLYKRSRKGSDMAEWPEDLRVREFPVTR